MVLLQVDLTFYSTMAYKKYIYVFIQCLTKFIKSVTTLVKILTKAANQTFDWICKQRDEGPFSNFDRRKQKNCHAVDGMN